MSPRAAHVERSSTAVQPPDPPELSVAALPQSREADRLMALSGRARTGPSPLVRLDRARATADDGERAALEQWARGEERWSLVAELLSLRAQAASDAQRIAWLLEAATIAHDRLRRFDWALRWIEAARAARATPSVLTRAAELLAIAGRPREAIATLEQLLSLAVFPRQEQREVALRLFRLAASPRLDPVHRVAALRHASSLDRSNAAIRQALVAALEQARERWPAETTALPPSDAEIATEMAELALGRQPPDAEAIEWLARSLALREDADVRDAHTRALAAARRFGELQAELEEHARRVTGRARAARLCGLAEAAAQPPWSRPEVAREAFLHALDLDPELDAAFDWLAADARLRGDSAGLDQLTTRRLMRLFDPARRNAVRHSILPAAVSAADWTAAGKLLAGILLDDPDDGRALALAEHLCEGPAWREGLAALVAGADAEPQGRAAVERLATCLRVAAEHDAPVEIMLPLVARLLQREPRPDRVETIRALQARAGCDDRALASLQARIDASLSAAARADALRALGELHRDRWELERAWTAFEQALVIDPTDPEALEALHGLVHEPSLEDRTEAVLRRRLASIEAGRLPAQAPGGIDALRARLLRELAARTTDDDEALALHRRRLELDGTDADAADEVGRILARKGDSFALAVHLDGRLVHAAPEARASLTRRLAHVLAHELGEIGSAIGRWEELARAAEPDDLHAPLELAALLSSSGQPARAVEVWNRVVATLPPGSLRADLLRRIARATREPSARAAAFRRVLGARPDDVEATRELLDHYAARGEAAFARELAHQLARVSPDPAEQVSALVRAAALELPEDAIGSLRRALALDAASAPALERLEEAARTLEDWPTVVEVLERQLVLTDSTDEQLDLAISIAAIWSDRLDEPEAAARSLERARRLDPSGKRIAEQLAVLYERAEDWPALARLLRARIDEAPTTESRIELTLRLAAVHQEHLDEPEVAVQLFREVQRLDPQRADAEQLEVDALARAGAWDRVVERLQQRAALAPEGPARAEAWLLVADLCDRAMRGPGAAFDASVQRARETGPDPSSLALLVHHGRAARRLQDAVVELDALASAARDPLEGATALACASELLERELAAPSAALDRALEILRRLGAGPRTAATIERLAHQEGRIEDWVSAELEREQLSTDRAERVESLLRAARLLDEVLGRPARAFDLLLRAMTIEPEAEAVADWASDLAEAMDESSAGSSARARLAEQHRRLAEYGSWHLRRALALYDAIGHRCAFDAAASLALAAPEDREVRAMLPVLAGVDRRWSELLSVYDELAGLVRDRDQRHAIRLQQAALLQDQLGRPQPSRALLQEVLLERPSLPGLHGRALEAARASGQGREMAAALETRLGDLEAIDRAAALRWLAELFAVVLDAPDDVARVGQELLALEPGDARITELVVSALGQLSDWDPLAEIVWARAQSESGTGADAAQAADLFLVRLGDPERALAAWRRALELGPVEHAWLSSLVALLERMGDWRELVPALGRMARSAPTIGERVELLLRQARVTAAKLGDREGAIAILEEALALDRTAVSVVRDLEKLYELAGRAKDLATLRSSAADQVESPEHARELLVRLARDLEAKGDVDGAIDALWRAIELTPEYVPTYGRLRQLLLARGSPEEVVDLLLREAHAWTDPAETSARLSEAAAIVARKLHDEDRARGLYRQALEVFERCRPAAHALAEDAERRGELQEALHWLESLRRWTVQPEEVERLDRRIERVLTRAHTRILR